MFTPSRDEARRFFFDTWSKYRRGEPLVGLEQPALSVILLHSEYHGMLGDMEKQGARIYDREAAIVLRAIEKGARETRNIEPGEAAYLALMARLLQRNRTGVQQPAEPTNSLIIP